MAYKCNNVNCEKFNKICNPGGTIVIRGTKPFFTGSVCTGCGKTMEHTVNEMGDFKSINNKEDGRNR